jgi:hypothetical protein
MRAVTKKCLTVALAVGLAAGIGRLGPPPVADPPADDGADEQVIPPVVRGLAKRQIARAVIDERLPLLRAAALYADLNRWPPRAAPLALADDFHCPLRLPARTEEERLCREVVRHVWAELRGGPEEPAVAARLRGEFDEALRRDGAIRLPALVRCPPPNVK